MTGEWYLVVNYENIQLGVRLLNLKSWGNLHRGVRVNCLRYPDSLTVCTNNHESLESQDYLCHPVLVGADTACQAPSFQALNHCDGANLGLQGEYCPNKKAF